MPATLWSKPGLLIINGASVDASHHRHHALQIVWPVTGAVCQYDEGEISGPLLIASQVEHQLSMGEGWLLLVEPRSSLGQQLLAYMDAVFLDIHIEKKDTIYTSAQVVPIKDLRLASAGQSGLGQTPEPYLGPLFKALNLPLAQLTGVTDSAQTQVSDPRIQALLIELDGCFAGECLKPASWRAVDVATQLGLSQSRFLHLFSEQMGIAWRPYLLWRRMGCAVAALLLEHSATEAAHRAGFSDSAHLSRTFRRQFGMTIRQAQQLFLSP